MMRLELSPRQNVWPLFRLLSPIFAMAMAGLLASLVIMILGQSPQAAFDVYVLGPLDDSWAIQEIAIKMVPLVLIATGLSFCFRANLWNIGAEGQFTFGARFDLTLIDARDGVRSMGDGDCLVDGHARWRSLFTDTRLSARPSQCQ